jgi:LacI family transcriptional regulator
LNEKDPLRRVTLKDVASKAGVHYSTVSLALSGSPKLPVDTRKRIQAIAEKMGYQPDAALSALNAYRAVKQSVRFQATLAVVSNHPKPSAWREYFTGAESYAGMWHQAQRLGYQIEEFSVAGGRAECHRLEKVLHARNITGIIAGPMVAAHTSIELDWEKYSAIALGFSLESPLLHRVASSHLRNTERCMLHLAERGYTRIGFAMLQDIHERVGRLFGAGYDIVTRRLRELETIPFFMPDDYESQYTPQALKTWIRKHRIQAVLTSHNGDLLRLLPEAGLRIPQDIAVVNVAAASEERSETGVLENNELIGSTAVKLLVSMLQHDERGVPLVPHQTTIDGRWIDGNTVGQINK